MGRSVRTPVEALRIILEDVTRGSASDRAVDAAISTLGRVRKNVQAIEDYYQPASSRALRCTVGEIIGGVRGGLVESDAVRLLVAVDETHSELVVDGPLLVKSLVRLVENAMEAGSGAVMLHVDGPRPDEGRAYCAFSVVSRGAEPFDLEDMARPFRSDKRGHLGLGLTLAARDATRMGGKLALESGRDGMTRFAIELDETCIAVEAA